MPQLQISHEPISLALVGPGCRAAVVFQGNPELYTSYPMTPTELLTHRVCLSRIGDEVLPGSYLSRSITSHYLCLRGFPRHYSVCTDATLDARARPLQHGRQNRLPKVPGLPSTEHSPSVDTVVQESSKLFAYCRNSYHTVVQ